MATAVIENPGSIHASVVTIAEESAASVAAREALLDRVMGRERRMKSSEGLRRGLVPAEGLAFAAHDADGTLVGTVRLWNVAAGIDAAGNAVPALLLGPLAVEAHAAGTGIGSALMRHAIDEAHRLGHRAILLVGDAPYYGRFGFETASATLTMPGPFARERFLALELAPGALDGAVGILAATGRREVPQTL